MKKSLVILLSLLVCLGSTIAFAQTDEEFLAELYESGKNIIYSQAVTQKPTTGTVLPSSIPSAPNGNKQAILPQDTVVTDFSFSNTSQRLYAEYVFTPNTAYTPMRIRMTTGQSASGVFTVRVYEQSSDRLVTEYPNLTIYPSGNATIKELSSSYFEYRKGYYIEVEYISGGKYLSMVVN